MDFFRRLWLVICIGGFGYIQAQAPQDTTAQVMTLAQVYEMVLAYHPVAQQATLLNEKAKQELRMARGGFDPKLQLKQDAKIFKGKDYYTLWNTYLKVPTWWGIELKAGHEQNTGINLNPESDTDSEKGLGYVGISVPLGPLSRNFLMDERRAALRNAQIYQDMAVAERQKVLNKLLYQVAKDYWEWYFQYHQVRLFEYGYDLALFRFRSVVNQVEQGYMAKIDSVEAKITLQQREIDLNMARVAMQNAQLILSNHLWNEEEMPLELVGDIAPVPLPDYASSIQTLASLKEFAEANHPELVKLRMKQEQLQIGRKLAIENLKPDIQLKYNWLLQKPIDNGLNTALLTENYKWGVGVSMPLLLRKERGKLGLAKVKIQDNLLEQQYLEQQILNGIGVSFNTLTNLSSMLDLQGSMVENYRVLLAGEGLKFRNGQSSVFYMNVREGKLIEAEVKLFKMRTKYAKGYAELLWSAGALLE